LAGFGGAGMAFYYLLMAKYGLRGIFLSGKPWRILFLVVALGLILLGGFRSSLMGVMGTFILLFFWEGLHRTPLLMVVILLGALGTTALVPLAHKLPFTFQRSLAFLPLDLDAEARMSAEDSTQWRLNMWSALLPQIPPHLLLGKGLAFTPEEFEELMAGNSILASTASSVDASQGSLAMAGDYHNGMLSLIIPFGIWGVITFFWFMVAGTRVLYLNAKYGRPDLLHANAFLLMLFGWEALNFASCLGGLQIASELASFVGFLGLSISLNNGVRQPEGQSVEVRPSVVPFRSFARPRPVFLR